MGVEDFTVVVATFGSPKWAAFAQERAIPSAEGQAAVIHTHGDTLAEARNAGLAQVETEFVIHLDADDQLEPGYVEAVSRGTADLRCPRVRYVAAGRVQEPTTTRVWAHDHDCEANCLRHGNWLVIGTAARADLLRSVGGWEEWGWSEDWALWARAWVAGATVELIPDAIYRAWLRRSSRNRASLSARLRWHREIETAIWGSRECAAR